MSCFVAQNDYYLCCNAFKPMFLMILIHSSEEWVQVFNVVPLRPWSWLWHVLVGNIPSAINSIEFRSFIVEWGIVSGHNSEFSLQQHLKHVGTLEVDLNQRSKNPLKTKWSKHKQLIFNLTTLDILAGCSSHLPLKERRHRQKSANFGAVISYYIN